MDALQVKVKDLVAKHPDMTAAQVAEKVGISLPTAIKWMDDGSPKKAKTVKVKVEKEVKAVKGGKRGRPRKVTEPEPMLKRPGSF